MIPILPSITIIGKGFATIISSVGSTLIGDKIAKYLKGRFSIFEKEYEKTEGIDRIVILQKELLGLKNLQIELLEGIINGNYKKEEEEEMLKEFKDKTIFISEMEKLLK